MVLLSAAWKAEKLAVLMVSSWVECLDTSMETCRVGKLASMTVVSLGVAVADRLASHLVVGMVCKKVEWRE